jgi:hypothetical protein
MTPVSSEDTLIAKLLPRKRIKASSVKASTGVVADRVTVLADVAS